MPRNRYLLEAQNSILACVVGLVFIADYYFDGSLYTRFPDTYRYMKFIPSLVWGAVYLSLGMAHLLALTSRYEFARKQVLLIKSGAWVFLSISVIHGDVFAASGWCYFVFAVFAVISFWKIRRHEDSHYEVHCTSGSDSGNAFAP